MPVEPTDRPPGRTPSPPWTFLTNHAHVLVCLAAEPDLRLREVAERVGITERAVQHIVGDLETAGVLTRSREGRRNHYALHLGVPLRHPIEAHVAVADLVRLVHPAPAALDVGREAPAPAAAPAARVRRRAVASTRA